MPPFRSSVQVRSKPERIHEPRTWRLLREAINILLEAMPTHLDAQAVQHAWDHFDGVVNVHDLHIWTITSGVEALSAHVVLADAVTQSQTQALLEATNERLRTRFQIEHTTIQFEFRDLQGEESAL